MAKRILYLPLLSEGLALPNRPLYCWAAVLVTVQWWFSQPRLNPAVTLEAAILGSYAALSNLAFGGRRAFPSITIPMQTMVRAWQEARAIYKKPFHISPHMPLWGNPMLPHLLTLTDPSLWARRGITTVRHITKDGKLTTFPDLRALYSIPRSWEFRYWQLRHAFGAQFPATLTLESDSVERLLISSSIGRPLYSYTSI